MIELLVGFGKVLLGVPCALLDLLHLGEEFLVLGIFLQAAAIFPEVLHENRDLLTEVFHDLLLVVEADVEAVEGLEVLVELFLQLLLATRCLGGELTEDVVILAVQLAQLIAKLAQALHVALTRLDLLVEDHAVEALLAVGELVGEAKVAVGGEAELVQMFGDLDLGILDALGDFDLLFACQKRHLAHLLEIHADRVVENIEFLVCLGLLLTAAVVIAFLVFVAVDFGGINDVKLHVAQALHDGFDIFGFDQIIGQDVIDVIKGQVFLLLRQLDEFADLLLNLRSVDARLLATLVLGEHFGSFVSLGLLRSLRVSHLRVSCLCAGTGLAARFGFIVLSFGRFVCRLLGGLLRHLFSGGLLHHLFSGGLLRRLLFDSFLFDRFFCSHFLLGRFFCGLLHHFVFGELLFDRFFRCLFNGLFHHLFLGGLFLGGLFLGRFLGRFLGDAFLSRHGRLCGTNRGGGIGQVAGPGYNSTIMGLRRNF